MAGLSPLSVTQLNSNFNIGNDRVVTLVDDQNNYINLGKVLDFVSTPEVVVIAINPINNGGRTLRKQFFNGWKGTVTVARENGVLDQLHYNEEIRYHTGVQQRYYTLYETTINQDGTMQKYQYVKCVVRLGSAGTWKKESDVPLTLEFECEERLAIQA